MNNEPASSPRLIAGVEYARATRLSLVAGGLGALFLTVCNNQPIFAVYLSNHLGAPPSLLGALFGLMLASGGLQLVSVFVYRALPRRKGFFIGAHVLHRALGLVIAGSALLFAGGLEGAGAAEVAAFALGLSWVAMNLSSSGWMSWMADLVPEDVRGTFFLRRSAIFQGATVAWFFAASVLLDLVPEAGRSYAYALIFGIGALGGMADILLHLGIPEPRPHPAEGRLGPGEFFAPLRDANFLRFSVGIGMAVFAVFVAAPFQAPWVTAPDGIAAPNVWLGIMTVISVLAWVAMAPLWGFVMDRYGRRPAVILGCLLVTGWIGYLFIDDHNYAYILPLVAVVSGFFGPAFWDGSAQLMLTLAPAPRRVVYIAWYNTIVGLVAALGPVVGGLLYEGIGMAPTGGLALPLGLPPLGGFAAAQVAALLSMAAAVLVLRGVREGRERPVAGLVGQMASTGLFRSYASLLDLKRQSGDPRVARALRRIDGDEGELVIREVIERLDDPSPETREEAARALSRIRTEESRRALEALLGDRGSDLRIEAARALGRLGDPASLPILEAALASDDPALRAACAGALGSLGVGSDGSRLAVLLAGEREARVHEAAALGASSRASAPGEGGEELTGAALELSSRLAATRNRALRGQYALGLANLLGNAGAYERLTAGDSVALAVNRRLLVSALGLRVAAVLGPRGDQGRELLDRLATAMAVGEGRRSLAILLELHGLLLDALFGSFGRPGELRAILARSDQRLSAWQALAETLAPAELDDEAALHLALVGTWYLGSE